MDARVGVPSQAGTAYDEFVETAAASGVDFVELVLEGAGERRRLGERADAVTAALSPSMDLVAHLPFGGVDVGSPLEHVRAGALRELKAGIDLTARLGGEKAVFHADTFVRTELWDEAPIRSNVFDAVSELHAYGRERSVTVAVENVPGPFVSIETFPELLARTDAPMTLDTGHARVSGYDDGDLAAFVADHGDRIAHFHLNDTRGASDEHLPVGMGTTDFGQVFEALPDDWTGTMTVEAFASEFEFLTAGVDRLRNLLEEIDE